ncbi:hypothetical protein NEPTK9_001414 [Candidatus Neptunochlamydia vexilliferae]|uniref:CAAX prenyl protease 2/Lysostaphin resistance protein A-like domain-containing protein n=2 Tax=Candidatus Neptunichlamydia vexilliferae TaxID=1651774 RepID=A0ABS0B0K5_9BACT|nr:hypothetical protein [Candidatus Neptunochlamydia vexilliferae]
MTSLAFISLILAFMSLWMHRKPWLWGSFLALSFIFALYGKVIDLKIFVALILLGGAHLALTGKLKGVPRLITIIIAIFLSVVLMGHFFPGFYNWKIAGELQISENAYPYSLYLNYDKPFIGFFPLALSIPLLSRFHLRSVFVKTVALTTLGVIVLVILSLYFHLVEIDLKFPHITWVWLIANLFLVVIPEEAFFRGFLQRELSDYLNAKWGGALSVVAVSLFFALLHFTFVRDLGFLSLTFIASLVYGSIYQMTRSIESSIFCHYLFNLIHFFCFTYPALRG